MIRAIWNILHDDCTGCPTDRQLLVDSACELLKTEWRQPDPSCLDIWYRIWDKPFWAGRRSGVVGPSIRELRLAKIFLVPEALASSDWDFDANGAQIGTDADRYCAGDSPYNNLRVNRIVRARKRVCIVVEWARGLPHFCAQVRSHLEKGSPTVDELASVLREAHGVGPATAMHALAALGIATMKPDRWLVRFWWSAENCAGHCPPPSFDDVWANLNPHIPAIAKLVSALGSEFVRSNLQLAGSPELNAAARSNPIRFVDWVIAHFGMEPERWVGIRRRPADLLMSPGFSSVSGDTLYHLARIAAVMHSHGWLAKRAGQRGRSPRSTH